MYVNKWQFDPYGNDNVIYLKQNKANNYDNSIFPTALNYQIEKNFAKIEENFTQKEFSSILTNSEITSDFYKNKEQKTYFDKTVGIIFNPNNDIFSNPGIKKAFAISALREGAGFAFGIISPEITFANKKYREMVSELEIPIYDEIEANSLISGSLEELGLNSLPNISIIIPENLSTDELYKIKQNWEKLFDIFVTYEILPLEEYKTRLETKDYQLAMVETTAKYDSISNYFANISQISGAIDIFAEEINSIQTETSINQVLEKSKALEMKMVNDGYFIPVYYNKTDLYLNFNNKDINYLPFSQQVFYKYAKYFQK
jgi:oligopeptide transport system substrate-binding protein